MWAQNHQNVNKLEPPEKKTNTVVAVMWYMDIGYASFISVAILKKSKVETM